MQAKYNEYYLALTAITKSNASAPAINEYIKHHQTQWNCIIRKFRILSKSILYTLYIQVCWGTEGCSVFFAYSLLPHKPTIPYAHEISLWATIRGLLDCDAKSNLMRSLLNEPNVGAKELLKQGQVISYTVTTKQGVASPNGNPGPCLNQLKPRFASMCPQARTLTSRLHCEQLLKTE